ncbi:MAG: hypothetical protein KBF88_01205 [Polyangiaceae bacterium]|nr:hypothetical protein [Polyangiaceae bacterium]
MRSNSDAEKEERAGAPLPEDPPTQTELEESQHLRRSLESSGVDDALGDFAVGLRAMAGGSASSKDSTRPKQLEARIAEGMKRGAERNRFRRFRNVGVVATGLSLAAAAMLLLQTSGAPSPTTSAMSVPPSTETIAPTNQNPLAPAQADTPRRSRSAAEYFLDEGSMKATANLEEGSRGLDRLIAARLDDYRENRFRAWGVR